MFDINEIKKRAQQASERAADAMKETFEKSEEIVKKAEEPDSKKSSSVSAAEVEEQIAANTQRQVEILGQMFGADGMAQMAVNEELLQKMVNDKVAEATASTAETFMGQLFGEDMVKRQTDGPVLRRNINRWLADNCFGDYYTRNGLNDQEREMITFCFILAQGGCENQLRGHTVGNFGVGNDKEKLYSIVEQCMPYIGYPRSLNAMNIIDEVSRAMENQ